MASGRQVVPESQEVGSCTQCKAWLYYRGSCIDTATAVVAVCLPALVWLCARAMGMGGSVNDGWVREARLQQISM